MSLKSTKENIDTVVKNPDEVAGFVKDINFPKAEEQILRFWKQNQIFEKSQEQNADGKEFSFLDGPPFATGHPHYGHILSGTIKDTICRYQKQRGRKIDLRFGWDCHGLPVEYEIDKIHGITSINDVEKMGIEKYNQLCRGSVEKYSGEWDKVVERSGRWIVMDGYKTMDVKFMNSVWSVFSVLFKKNFVYRAFRIMPYSTACKTPLSNFEATQNYKDVSDPSVLIRFKADDKLRKKYQLDRDVYLVAWTTTPWTLVSNCALAINKDLVYVGVETEEGIYIVLKDRKDVYFKDKKVVFELEGRNLEDTGYQPLYKYYENFPSASKGFFRVYAADFVSNTGGTGVVHCAPAFGAEDYQMFLDKKLLEVGELPPCPIDENGVFTETKFKGLYFKDADKEILKDLRQSVVLNTREVHSYPFCWRSDTPLMYKCVANWFVAVSSIKEKLVENNKKIHWVPKAIGEGRFANWLKGVCDWSISRNRFWGTPIPIWARVVDETQDTEHLDYEDIFCVKSLEELEKLTGKSIKDLHKEFIDPLRIKRDGKVYKRIPEVFDCWFESGSVPYAKNYIMVEDEIKKANEITQSNRSADFIAEGVDQTRGWFYTLHVISTILHGQEAFKNVIVNGIVLAENGKKMSKRLKNYPDPLDIIAKYGADAMRLYLISSPVVEGEDLRFSEKGVKEVLKALLIPWHNTLLFLTNCEPRYVETEMDSWIIARLSTFASFVSSSMEEYHLNEIYSKALLFIENLSNWYIRLNRKNLRRGGWLLARILQEFSVCMAPFTPFFSEYVFLSIRKIGVEDIEGPSIFPSFHTAASVHLSRLNDFKSSTDPFDKPKAVIEAIRALREKLGIMLKRTIWNVTVLCDSDKPYMKYIHLIKNECNLLNITFDTDYSAKYSFSTQIKPNFLAIRNKFSGDRKAIKDRIALITSSSREFLLRIIDGEEKSSGISHDELIVTRSLSNLPNSVVYHDFSLIFDLDENEMVKSSSMAREFYSFVQSTRKSSLLSPSDHVVLVIPKDAEIYKSCTSQFYPSELEFIFTTDSISDSMKFVTTARHKDVDVKFYLVLE